MTRRLVLSKTVILGDDTVVGKASQRKYVIFGNIRFC